MLKNVRVSTCKIDECLTNNHVFDFSANIFLNEFVAQSLHNAVYLDNIL